ncbi:MAG: stage II sporulation protein M [Thermoflavifilum sp.]|nr:stage II sporulation protein M [Thermoflavifilum sp.]MCL6513508.1 stage II sporulation protein M [Alicyclobacillus sp.]
MSSEMAKRQDRAARFGFTLAALVLFGAGLACGLTWPSQYLQRFIGSLEALKQLADWLSQLHNPWLVGLFLFLHNLLTVILISFLGFFFGIYPAWALWQNGVLTGAAVASAAQSAHVPAWKMVLYGIAPHGIFEIPAVIWGAVLGMDLGYCLMQVVSDAIASRVSERSSRLPEGFVGRRFRRVLRRLPYIVGLLVIAAVIESTVTPMLLSWGAHVHTNL